MLTVDLIHNLEQEYVFILDIKLTLVISNSDISRFPLTS